MTNKKIPLAVTSVWCLLQSLGGPALASDLTSPDLVKTSLQRFTHDYDDMTRKLNAGTYDRLAREHEDFQKDAGSLRAAIAGEPTEFKSMIEAELTKTLDASGHVADISRTRDGARVRKALDALAGAIRELNAAFPEKLRSS